MTLPNDDSLSEREVEILRLVATGASNKEIAAKLVISPNTVKVHLRNIFAKIDVVSRTEATLYAIRQGWVPDAVPPTPETESPDEVEPVAGSPLTVAEATRETVVTRPRSWLWAGMLAVVLILGIGGLAAGRFLLPATPTATQSPAVEPAFPPRWTQAQSLPTALEGMAGAAYENALFLIGGSSPAGVTGDVRKYDLTSLAWESGAGKPTPVREVQAAVIGERIFIPGGITQNGKTTDVLEAYNPRSDTWETRARLPRPLSGYGLAALEGTLYLVGGRDGQALSDRVYAYDPDADAWRELARTPTPLAFAACTSGDGKIYVVGGFDGKTGLQTFMAFYPGRAAGSESPWEMLSPLPAPLYGASAVDLGGLVFAFGGLSKPGVPVSNTPLVFQSNSAAWVLAEKPAGSETAFGAAVASGNSIHMMGGDLNGSPTDRHLVFQAFYTIAIPVIQTDQ